MRNLHAATPLLGLAAALFAAGPAAAQTGAPGEPPSRPPDG